MLLNLTDILTSEQKVEEKQVLYDGDTFDMYGTEYEIVEKSAVTFLLVNNGKGKATVSGHMELKLSMVCDRCLKPVMVPLQFDFEENIIEDELENPDDADTYFYMDGYKLDTEKLLSNEILINWPPKVLCREDCKGICKQCGKDRNLGDCGCDDFIPDPRMAVIKDIFNAG